MPKVFTTVGRVATGVLTLGASEIPVGKTTLNSVSQFDQAPKPPAAAIPAPIYYQPTPTLSASQPVDLTTTWLPSNAVSPGGGGSGVIAGDASIDPALFDYYNKPQQTQPA